jgi:DNA-binding NarL/FixJ family response regulator
MVRALRVLIVDDHRLMIEAVRAAFADVDEIEVVGETCNGPDVLPLVASIQPDVVLLDIRMPGIDGLRCLELIQERHPAVRVVMFSALDDPEVIETALSRGARAFVVKHIDPADLPSAIRQAMEQTVFQPFGLRTSVQQSAADDAGLTEAQMRVLNALARGLSNKQIAKELWLSEQTVKFHLGNIYRQLDVSSRSEAIRYAYRHRLVADPVLESA